ncbi:hypothetical protein Vafri_7880, partial [Volvox africanus]
GASGQRSERPGNSAYMTYGSYRMDGWYVDSGASQHITYDERDLINVRRLDASTSFDIYSIGGEVLRPVAMGTLVLAPNFCPGLTATIADVYLIPESQVKVLSVAVMSKTGAVVRTVAASSVEAEYQALSSAVREALWLSKLSDDLKI